MTKYEWVITETVEIDVKVKTRKNKYWVENSSKAINIHLSLSQYLVDLFTSKSINFLREENLKK